MITLVEIDTNVQGESTSSLTIGTGSKSFTLANSEPFIKGMTVVATEISAGLRTTNTMTGTVTSASGTSLVVNVSSVSGSGTIANWIIDGVRTLYLGTETYISKSTDTPALTEYQGLIQDPGDIAQYMYKAANTFGFSEVAKGDIVCVNKAGELDWLRDVGFKSAGLRIKKVSKYNDALPTSNSFAGSVIYPDIGLDRVIFGVADRLAELDKPAQEVTFLGTNSGATGIEGSGDGIKGQIKPFMYGGPLFHVPATLVNESSRIYALNFDYLGGTEPVATITTVYDEGLAKTLDTAIGTSGDFANLAALQGATIGAGKYATCVAEGLFRFSGAANGVVTAAVTQTASQSAADIVKSLIERIGFTSSDYVGASFTALETANSSAHELYHGSDETVLTLCNEILEGIGGYLISNTDNKFEVGRLENPDSGISAHTFDQYNTFDLQIIGSEDPGKGIPPKQIKINYKKNYRPMQDSEFAGAVTPSDRLLLGPEYKESVGSVSENIEAKHFNPPIFVFNSHFTTEANADTERSRQETLRQAERRFYSFNSDDPVSLNLGQIVTLEIDRIGLSSGKKVVIMGKELNKTNLVTYLVWG